MNNLDWIKIAERILKGEFQDTDNSTVVSILIGLRSATDEKSKRAVKILSEFHKIDPTKINY